LGSSAAQCVGPGALDHLAHGRLGLAVVAALDGLGHPLVCGQRLPATRH
jgi:hypothetical protein